MKSVRLQRVCNKIEVSAGQELGKELCLIWQELTTFAKIVIFVINRALLTGDVASGHL